MRFKSFDNFKSLKNLKIGRSKETPDGETTEAVDTSATQIASMEEQINNRTKDLAETEQQLIELTDTAKATEENEEAQPKPHGPLSELSIEMEDQLEGLDEEIDTETIVEEAGEVIKVVEVGTGATAPAEAATVKELTKEEGEKGEEKQEAPEVDSLNNLFSQDEEEENLLANLINSLPEVTAQELLDDLQEINEIIREGQHN